MSESIPTESSKDTTHDPLAAEEEKLRDTLRARREEARLRNLIRDKNRHKQEAAVAPAAGQNTSVERMNEKEHSRNSSDDKISKKETSGSGNESGSGRNDVATPHRRHSDARGGDARKRSRSPHRRSTSPGRNRRGHHRHHHNQRPAPQYPHYEHRYDRSYHPGGRPLDRHHDRLPDGEYDDNIDPYGRERRPILDRSAAAGSRRAGRSRSRSPKRSRQRGRSRSHSASSYSSRGNSRSSSSASSASSTSSRSSSVHSVEAVPEDTEYTKDQRTIFINQLVMRTTEKDISRFFRSKQIPTNEIILLRDKRTGKHKGSAYVELRRMADVIAAVNLSGQAPDFQRFPILIKASEAERNYVPSGTSTISIPPGSGAPVLGAPVVALTHQPVKLTPLTDETGKPVLAQKVYVGNLEANLVTSQHLHALFAPFGNLTEIQLQVGKGFAFLQFHDPKEAALAIQTMSGQMLAGRPMKTGWATNQGVLNGMTLVTALEFPPDASTRAQNAYHVLAQLTSGQMMPSTVVKPLFPTASTTAVGASRVPTVAEARASLAAAASGAIAPDAPGRVPTYMPPIVAAHPIPVGAGVPSAALSDADPTKIGNNPTKHVLVHNMFNKDEETEAGWEIDVRVEFEEECTKYGKIASVTVISDEPGGKIYVSFDSLDGAKTCASSLAGRWFDKRQLRVEYVSDDDILLATRNGTE